MQLADGRTRAFVNDQPVSVQVLKALGAALVEIHGQHDDRALVDMAAHRRLLDAYAGLEDDAAAVARLWAARRAAEEAVAAHRARVEQARREADYLRHAVEELTRLKPADRRGDRARREARRHDAVDKVAEDLRDAHEAVAGERSPVAALSAALRRLERRRAQAPALIDPPVKALDAALTALDDARAPSRRRAASPPTTIRASSSGSRSGCSRCARRRANTMCAVDDLAALRAALCRRSRGDRCRRGGTEAARSGGARGARRPTARPPRRCRPRGARRPRSSTRR